jgi:PII-like signaling protein
MQQLTVYCHAGQRSDGRVIEHVLHDEFTRRALPVTVVAEGAAGFGRSRRIRTDRVEATWNEIPVVATGVGERVAILGTAAAVRRLAEHALIVLAGLDIASTAENPPQTPLDGPAELSIHCRAGRGADDADGAAGVLEHLRDLELAGATVFVGREGTLGGRHRRNRLLTDSPDVPAIVTVIDDADAIARALPALHALSAVELLTVRRVAICLRDGRRLPAGAWWIGALPRWSRLSVYTGGELRDGRRPAHLALLSRLHTAGASGVTVLPARLGFGGDRRVRPERGWRGRRGTPVMTTIVDETDRIAAWLEIASDVMGDHGLVTGEPVILLDADGTPQ